jgi:GT2 family glycosyltransferase
MKNPFVAIIILSYNNKKDTLECLSSISNLTYQNYKIILVDNNSADDTVFNVRKKFPDVQIIQNPKNYGFAEGNNIGIKNALHNNFEYIMLLNNDTLVNPNFLDILIKNIESHPDYSVFGPQIRMYPEKNKIWYAGGKIIWPLGAITHFNNNDLITKTKYKKPTQVSFVNGAALLVKSEVFKKVGLLDKNFFLYWEETDWEARALKSSYKFLYVPDSVIWHKVGASSGGMMENPKMKYYFYRNNLLWAKKNLLWIYWPTFILFFIFRTILEIFRPGFKNVWFGISDFFKGKFGEKVFNA